MDILRTPDARFADLPDYDFAPHYTDIPSGILSGGGDRLRVHYLDEGPKDADPVLAMHGEPTWCYLYRRMIPVFTAAGHRVVAPDLVGFGRSDKPVSRSAYTYAAHVAWMTAWLKTVDLRRITLVCQDWGGLIGLRLWAAMPDRFARIVVANTTLPTGDHPMPDTFKAWRTFSQATDPFQSGRIVYGGTVSKITEAEQAAYDAPFPDETYQAGARQFPLLVPDGPDNPESEANRAAWQVIRNLDTPVLTVFGAEDKIMAGAERVFQKLKGAQGHDHVVLPGAGHFLQEDAGEELARHVNDFIAATG